MDRLASAFNDLIGVLMILAVFAGAGALMLHAAGHVTHGTGVAFQAYPGESDDMSDEDLAALYESVEVGDE
jgi:hypothetical protein